MKSSSALLLACVVIVGRIDAGADSVHPLEVPGGGRSGFTRLEAQLTGIAFVNQLSDARAATNRNLLSGSGVAAGDFDGDGWTDLYFCGLDNGNALYQNRGGWRFENVAAAAGVACHGLDSTGAVFADTDGDGDLDLLVSTLGNGVLLFANDGRGKFSNRTVEAGLQSKAGSMSMALADIDGDSDLDLYLTNFRVTTIRDRPQARFHLEHFRGSPRVVAVDGRPITAPDLTNRFTVAPWGEVLELGEADFLYENDGDGRFRPVSFTAGRFLDETGGPLREPPRDWGLAVQFHDFTGDGAPDIYVCNDYWTPDRIWINDGKGNFRAAAAIAIRATSRSSMGVDFADIDRDGNVDFYVVDMLARRHDDRHVQVNEIAMFFQPPEPYQVRLQLSQNTFQLNRGDATFAQISDYCGLEASEWSWCPVFLDVDLDGWMDLLISNGHLRDFQSADASDEIRRGIAAGNLTFHDPAKLLAVYPRLESTKAAFRNNGDLTFTDMSREWGFTTKAVSQGLCLADLDNDGDLDLVTNNLQSPAGIYRNESSAPRIALRLHGAGRNSSGVGARITLRGTGLPQTQEIIAGGRYLAGDAIERVFAAPGTNELSLEIRWRDGTIQVLRNLQRNHRYQIIQKE